MADDRTPLFSYVMQGRTTWGTRLQEDGHVEALSDTEVSFDDEAGFVAAPAAPGWRPRARLSPDDVALVREELDRAGFWDLPPEPDAGARIHSDAATVEWRAATAGRSHVVVTRGDITRHPALEGLRSTFEELVAAALAGDTGGRA